MGRYFKQNRAILFLLLLGLAVRLFFLYVGAEHYFNRSNIYVDGDTMAFAKPIEIFFETGSYTGNPGHESGLFTRMPGYPLFIGVFYLFTGNNWNQAWPLIAWIQILFDVLAIFFVFQIAEKLLKSGRIAFVAGLVYAVYPFIIVWNPVIYAESFSVFLLVFGAWLFFVKESKASLFFAAWVWGFGILVRPQLAFIFPAAYLFFFLKKQSRSGFLKKGIVFFLGFALSYGLWPARNYFFHQQWVFTQSTEAMSFYAPDVKAFRSYIYSVKAEWEPQFSQIVKGEQVDWPARSYHTAEDSLLLEKAVSLARSCGKGFSYWRRAPIQEDCNEEIVAIVNQLKRNQVKAFPLNYYLWVPLQNLAKSVFKINLNYQPSTTFAKNASYLLFLFRTLLILLGLAGCIKLMREKEAFGFFALLFWVLVYFFIAFINRNVEIRYLLQADVLLLIPAAMIVVHIIERIPFFKSNNKVEDLA